MFTRVKLTFTRFSVKAIYDALYEIVEIEQVTEQVIEQVEKVLEVIGNQEHLTKELINLLGLKHRATFRNKYLLPALENGLICSTGYADNSKQRDRIKE